jgi:UDP-N-acetylmuramoylalanine--D-glutamate ligase
MVNKQNTVLRIAGGQLLEARRAALGTKAPHSLEAVAEVDGVVYINDSRATFLDATLASLALMERRTVWIAGAWSDDMSEGHVRGLLQERVSAVVLFGPQGDVQADGLEVVHAGDLRTAVFVARELAVDGDAVLFSPACPSGNGFANYEERGAEFKRAVRDL